MQQLETILNSEQIMTSLEIAKLTSKRHTHVLRDIRKVFEELEIDETLFGSTYLDSSNRQSKVYNLNKDLTLTLISGYNAKLRFAIIKRWRELEELHPTDYPTALRAYADEVEKTLALEAQAKLNEPKVLFCDDVIATTDSIIVGQYAKNLNKTGMCNVSPNKLMKYLRDAKYLMSGKRNTDDKNVPYQKYVDKGYFENK
ncbi:MAG: hypothetical protein DRP42_05025, partial [Tenericutes bacterium]